MSFFVYLFVLLVAASSVLFGLDWMQAPLQPPGRPQQSVAVIAAPVQPAPAAATTAAAAATSTPAAAPVRPATNAAATPLTGAVSGEVLTGSTPTEGVTAEETEAKPAPLCDVDACERAYRTFTAADCTYKPSFEGPRKLCTRGNPPRRPSAQSAAKEANAQARCNISACESAYQTFDAATCTYQTYAGTRRVCTK
jgi:hypothetical protein